MTIRPKAHYWIGDAPKQCDFCEVPLSDVFTDGRTAKGQWAWMCDDCLVDHGAGLGTGRGQRYKRQHDGRWLKIAG